MALDLIECVDKGGTFDLKVSKDGALVETKGISDPVEYIRCLQAQIVDLKNGISDDAESQKEVDDVIASYEKAILILK